MMHENDLRKCSKNNDEHAKNSKNNAILGFFFKFSNATNDEHKNDNKITKGEDSTECFRSLRL